MFLRCLHILLFCFILFSYTSNAHCQEFNKIYEEVSQSSVSYLSEDELYYYSIDYAENIGSPELGFAIRTYDKTTGEVLRFLYHTIPDSWMFQGRCKKVVHIGNKMYFVYKVFDTIYIYEYNKDTYELGVLDIIVQPDLGVFTWDIQSINEKLLVTYDFADKQDSIQAKIFELDNQKNRKIIDIKSNKEIIQLAGLIREITPQKIVATGSWSTRDANNFKNKVGIFVMDTSYNVVSEMWTPIQDNAVNASDLIMINEDEILIMLKVVGWDYIFNKFGAPHYVYRINLKDGKILWKKNFTFPESTYTTTLGAMAKGHQEDTYFMCSSTYAKDIKRLDSIVTVGRVVKFRSNGSVIWQRDYLYTKDENYLRNNFNNIIATLDGYYLLGGETFVDGAFKAWLVKIDEDGHIVGDTTSSIQWKYEKWKDKISIYPNPVVDLLFINQDDLKDVEYHLINMQGQLIEKVTIQNSFQTLSWDISTYPSGNYEILMYKKGKFLGRSKVVKN